MQKKYLLPRRHFLKCCAAFPFLIRNSGFENTYIHTVKGQIKPAELGVTLIHEHVLVDFIGADKISPARWNHADVIRKVLPYLLEARSKGIKSMMECTPAFLGRDVVLLEKLADQSGLNLLTNTGYYGASDNKYLPQWAFTETAEQLAKRWIDEFDNGIEKTSVKPGFIKIGVNDGHLSELHQKLIKAAALTHLKTGLTICSHTGPAIPANEQIEILKTLNVDPAAFVWVHARGSHEELVTTAASGCWISLDGINEENAAENAERILFLKKEGFLKKILISHDAGWYQPGEPDGGKFRGYTAISEKLLPVLKQKGMNDTAIEQLMVKNPATAFAVSIRRY
ncbi:phosphotriesterase family protein [Dyadobacter sediminis]|uniref:Phosphotriesterase n=1 Tax=Dyadobacter sediminis TaxID=1493691 RepID=A0A5R9KK04_9BACT|nr:phosphotriesterase [Dyadobacter sediminis]TLU96533.1 phosphotriesterase [Dyadobacter sediminis]GGB82993.1 aryldialkylphosphatase [Dyadobacter sediminis]